MVSEEDNVVFGVTLSGRTAPVANMEKMIASTIVIMPGLVASDDGMLIVSFLRQVQNQAKKMITHKNFGVHSIRRLGNEAQFATELCTTLVIRHPKSKTPSPSALLDSRNAQTMFLFGSKNPFGL